MRRSLVIAACLVGCHGTQQVAEPQLAASPADFQRSIGLTLMRGGEPRRALPYLERLARFEPEKAAPLCYLARAYMDLAMWEQARGSIDRALVIEPRSATAQDLLGMLLDTRGDHDGAIDAHRRAIAFDPRNATFRNNLGFSYYLGHRYVDAVAAYREALRLRPNTPRVHNNLAFALAKLDQLAEASEHFRLGGTPAEAANNLGIAYEDRGDLEHAYEAYAAAAQADPDLAPARGNLERLAARLGKPLPRRD